MAVSPQTPRTLVVDDSMTNLRVASQLLAGFGIVAETAEDGQEAVDLQALHPYELIVMDLEMPFVDGFQAIRTIRESPAESQPYIIANTASTDPGFEGKARAAGCDAFLPKPLSPEVVKGAIGSAGWEITVPEDGAMAGDQEDADPPDFSDIPDIGLLNLRLTTGVFEVSPMEMGGIYVDCVERAREGLEELGLAIAASDHPSVHSVAHRIKGSTASFGMESFAEILAKIEGDGRNGRPASPSDLEEAGDILLRSDTAVRAVQARL